MTIIIIRATFGLTELLLCELQLLLFDSLLVPQPCFTQTPASVNLTGMYTLLFNRFAVFLTYSSVTKGGDFLLF